jgi:hypothetical protein
MIAMKERKMLRGDCIEHGRLGIMVVRHWLNHGGEHRAFRRKPPRAGLWLGRNQTTLSFARHARENVRASHHKVRLGK